jgi:peroxidase
MTSFHCVNYYKPEKPTMAGTTCFTSLLLIISSLFLAYHVSASEVELDYSSVPVVKGLSWEFYDSSCPKLESVVRKHLKKVFKENIGLAAALLRVHFHDCFVKARNSLSSCRYIYIFLFFYFF